MYQQNNYYHKEAKDQQNIVYRQGVGYRSDRANRSGEANHSKKSSVKGFWGFIAIVIILITCSNDVWAGAKGSEQSCISGVSMQEEKNVSNERRDLRGNAKMSTRVSGKDYSYAHGYYFQFLSATEQIVYEEMIEALENYSTEAYVTPLSETSWINVAGAIRYDHPEYYWVYNGLSYYLDSDAHIRRIKISVPEDARYILPKLRSYAESVAASVAGRNTYDAYLAIYADVASMATYGKAEGVDDQTISGIMMDHLGVCAGYSDTFKFLCDAAGLPCITVVGYGYDENGMNGGEHAWNMIMIDGSTYWVDVTWGDGKLEEGNYWYSCPGFYAYFCADDAMFLRTHSISYTMYWDDGNHFSAVYPSCTDAAYTWFSLHDLVFSSYEEAYSYIRGNLPQGNTCYWMQFTSREEMDRMINNITPDLIGELLQEAGVWYGEYHYFYDYCTMTLALELR